MATRYTLRSRRTKRLRYLYTTLITRIPGSGTSRRRWFAPPEGPLPCVRNAQKPVVRAGIPTSTAPLSRARIRGIGRPLRVRACLRQQPGPRPQCAQLLFHVREGTGAEPAPGQQNNPARRRYRAHVPPGRLQHPPGPIAVHSPQTVSTGYGQRQPGLPVRGGAKIAQDNPPADFLAAFAEHPVELEPVPKTRRSTVRAPAPCSFACHGNSFSGREKSGSLRICWSSAVSARPRPERTQGPHRQRVAGGLRFDSGRARRADEFQI